MNNDQMIIGNGNLTVYLDQNGLVHDARFPAVDSINRMLSYVKFNKIGIYYADAIHWLDDGTWDIQNKYYPGRLMVKTTAVNAWLRITLTIDTFVDYDLNVLCRGIKISSTDGAKNIKLFIHNSFQMGQTVVDVDCAQVVPRKAIAGIDTPLALHQGRSTWAAAGLEVVADNLNTDDDVQSVVGRYGQYDGQVYSGAWADAADGELSHNPMDIGKTDSVLGVALSISETEVELEHFVAFAESYDELVRTLHRYNMEGYGSRVRKTAEYWVDWLKGIAPHIKRSTSAQSRTEFIERLIELKANTMTSGAIDVDGVLLDHRFAGSKLVLPMVMAEAALSYGRIGAYGDAYRILGFLAESTGGGVLRPAYYASSRQSVTPYGWSTMKSQNIPPISIADFAVALIALTKTIIAVRHENIIGTQWRKLWKEFGCPLADQLAEYVIGGKSIIVATGRPQESAPAVKTIDIVAVYHALRLASKVADEFSDTSNVIKYGSAADNIMEAAGVLWCEDEGRFYDGPDKKSTIDSKLIIDFIDNFGVDLFPSDLNQLARDSANSSDTIAPELALAGYFIPAQLLSGRDCDPVIGCLKQINNRIIN